MGTTSPKFDSLSRLAHLEAISDAKRQISNNLSARMRVASADLNRAKQRLASIEGESSFQGRADAEIERVKTRIADLQAACADIAERQSTASAEWGAASRTHTRARQRAEELALPLPIQIDGDDE